MYRCGIQVSADPGYRCCIRFSLYRDTTQLAFASYLTPNMKDPVLRQAFCVDCRDAIDYLVSRYYAKKRNKKAGESPAWGNFLFVHCGLEHCHERVVLRLRQHMAFRINKLQTGTVVEVANLNLIIAVWQLRIFGAHAVPGAAARRFVGHFHAAG
ncbi:hypothetical protein PAJ_2093 [Pantoea ananatis AJ13355]|uniref:Uncharacterized protein n=1 Tax=Pantoea ananatis (strain AJ13355) TaxID=932677 RepID=A0A0H3KYN1_PANAA|nr:hypothetical protein PAJ_2093 [Pantoea ananatis AJ13355]